MAVKQVKTEEKTEETDSGFWDVDPLGALADLVTGAVFDGPKKAVKAVTQTTEESDNGNDSPGRREVQQAIPQNININLGDVFKRIRAEGAGKPGKPVKPKSDESSGSDATPDTEEEG